MMFTSIWSTAKLGGMVLATATLAAGGIAVGSAGSNPVLVAPPNEIVVASLSATDAAPDNEVVAASQSTDRLTDIAPAEVSDVVRQRIDKTDRRRDRLERAAALLGVTPPELRSAHADGVVDELIDDAGMTVDSFAALLLAPLVEHLDERVANGLMDEEHAATLLADVTSRVVAALSDST
ncbi:MAG: hypothetical protein HKN07_10820 [Acidimicrobiia bacterium]|nr:hypothetical protein [Acidimicrobiia bacterium]